MTETDEKQTEQEFNERSGPIVLDLSKNQKKKKKKRYSKNLEEIQIMERHLTRASHRVAKAIEKGIGTYRTRSTNSAEKKQDGAIRDFIPNSGIAMTRALKEIYLAPTDVARAFNTKPMRRRIRRQLRRINRN